MHYFLEIITSNPLIYTVDHPDLIVGSFMENSIGPKRVNIFSFHVFFRTKRLTRAAVVHPQPNVKIPV